LPPLGAQVSLAQEVPPLHTLLVQTQPALGQVAPQSKDPPQPSPTLPQ
jgi:hypothetical protein